MALSFAHGAIQWLAADAAATTYTVSGLSFQPKAIRCYTQGLGSATDTASEATHFRGCVGFGTSTSSRRCVAVQDQDAAGNMTCASGLHEAAIVATVTNAAGTPSFDGLLDLTAINSDGFVLTVDDQAPVNITVFWEAWGGSDITVASDISIAEPATATTVDYTVTGFTSNGANQVVMFAGCQSVSAAGTAEVQDSGLMVGFAPSTSAGDQVLLVANQDTGSANADVDGHGSRGNHCLGMVPIAGGATLDANATLSAWGTDLFTLNWAARATTNRRYIALAIKGGVWATAEGTIDSTSTSNTLTVSGLSFPPLGFCLVSRAGSETASGAAGTGALMTLGSATSTSDRRSMGYWSENGTGSAEVNLTIEYDQVFVTPTNAGAVSRSYDVNAMNSDGFQLIVDDTGTDTDWIGFLTFGHSTIPISESESVTVSEDRTVSIVTPVTPISINKSDGVTVSEAQDVDLSLYIPTRSDAVTIGEAQTLAITPLNLSEAESVTVTDAPTVRVPIYVTAAEMVSITDAIIARMSLYIPTISDTVTLAEDDNLTFFEGGMAITASDLVTVGETRDVDLIGGAVARRSLLPLMGVGF